MATNSSGRGAASASSVNGSNTLDMDGWTGGFGTVLSPLGARGRSARAPWGVTRHRSQRRVPPLRRRQVQLPAAALPLPLPPLARLV